MNRNRVDWLPPRSLSVAPTGEIVILSHEEHLRAMGISVNVSAAYDVVQDSLGHHPSVDWCRMFIAADKMGDDVMALARKLVEFHKILVPGCPDHG